MDLDSADILCLKSYLLTNESIYDMRLDEGRGGIERARGDSLLFYNFYINQSTDYNYKTTTKNKTTTTKNTTPHC